MSKDALALEQIARQIGEIAGRLKISQEAQNVETGDLRSVVRQLMDRLDAREQHGDRKCVTIQRYAAEHDIHPATVRRRIADGTLKSVRLGGRVLVSLEPP